MGETHREIVCQCWRLWSSTDVVELSTYPSTICKHMEGEEDDDEDGEDVDEEYRVSDDVRVGMMWI